jgi:hypothetical protein
LGHYIHAVLPLPDNKSTGLERLFPNTVMNHRCIHSLKEIQIISEN